ncbi:hypothetical protein Tco_0352283 [Tanacetum coccineum]
MYEWLSSTSSILKLSGQGGLMSYSGPLSFPRLASKDGQLGSTSIGVPKVSSTSSGLKAKDTSPYKRWTGKIVRTCLTQSDFGETNLGVWKDAFSVRTSENFIPIRGSEISSRGTL